MIRDQFSEIIKNTLEEEKYLIEQNEYDSKENLKYESLFALSNGYSGIRGSHEEGTKVTLPYLYINGVFDKSETFMRELATLPNWLGIKLYVEKQLIGIEDCEIISFKRVLNMKNSSLVKRVHLKDSKGRETLIEGIRFSSRANVHRMAVRLYVTPLNYDGIIEVENIIDGTIYNFYDAPRFKVKHTYLVENSPLENKEGCYMQVATRDNDLNVAVGSYLETTHKGSAVSDNRAFNAFGEQAIEFSDFKVKKNETYVITKYVSMYTEREVAKDELHSKVQNEIKEFRKAGFEAELKDHSAKYEKMWNMADIKIKGDSLIDKAVRFNIFHLMNTGNENDDRVNVGAKLLTGEEYGGHAFWDTELFMMPFFTYVFPNVADNLLNYRYNLLDSARKNAEKNGFNGAQYPWESADDGFEQCPDWTIEPDGSCYRCYVSVYEHHVTAAVAYGIYENYRTRKNLDFFYNRGIEILIETARFWASRCQYVEDKDRYEIRQVTGPDEWHEPVDNNLYTNYFAQWNIKTVLSLIEEIKAEKPELYTKLEKKMNLKDEEFKTWETVYKKIYLPRREGTDLLEQFEGYFKLKDVTIDKYDENDWPIRPEILKTVPIPETQIIKQADVMMLLYLMGDYFDKDLIKTNYDYYEKRTMHGSSLSPSIYAIMGLRVGDDSKAYRYLKRAATIDLLNLQGNTREGIHAANAGGIWQVIVFGFAGLHIDNEGILHINPNLPKQWEGLTFRLYKEGSLIEVSIKGNNETDVKLLEGEHFTAVINGETVKI